LNRATDCIQPGITRCWIRIDERNINGSPTKLAAAIIVASRRTSSAIPCEMPANTIATSAPITSTTSQPAAPPCTRTPSASPTSRMISACTIAVSPARTTCERTIDRRLAGVARNRDTTLRSRSVIIDMPAQVPPKNAFMTTIPGNRNSMYVLALPRRAGTRENSCP
jgi:hypothetical protein